MTTAVTLKGIKRRWIKATASTSEQQLLKKNADKKTFPATHIGTYTTFKIWHTKLKLDRTEMTVIGWIFSFTLKEKENNNNNNNTKNNNNNSSLALPAFLASAASTSDLQSLILLASACTTDIYFDFYLSAWQAAHGPLSPADSLPAKQSVRDKPGILLSRAAVESAISDPCQKARFLASVAPHSGDWLLALPVTPVGCGWQTTQYVWQWHFAWAAASVSLTRADVVSW